MRKTLIKLSTTALLLSLSACGLLPDRIDETKNWSAAKLYSEAKDELASGSYEKAVQLFERLESRHPFGVYAQQAQLEVAYAHYKSGDQAQGLAAVERFIKLHPNHPNLDYIYYLRGLLNFNSDLGFLSFIYTQDPTERDTKATRDAFDAFKQLVDKFPNSRYTPDATLRLKFLVNAMAQYEVHVARYYFRRGAYVAALNRAQTAVTDYNGAPAVEEALAIMVRSYDRMGMPKLRDDAHRVFQKNFPNSDLVSGPKNKDGWWKFW